MKTQNPSETSEKQNQEFKAQADNQEFADTTKSSLSSFVKNSLVNLTTGENVHKLAHDAAHMAKSVKNKGALVMALPAVGLFALKLVPPLVQEQRAAAKSGPTIERRQKP